MATIDKLTTTPEERAKLLAELNKKLASWEKEGAAWAKESAKLRAESVERDHQSKAHDLVRYLEKIRGAHFNIDVSGPLQKAVVGMIADLPANPPDPVAVRRREEARELVKQLGVSLSGAAESKLLQSLETAIEAADKMQWAADAPRREALERIRRR